MIQRRFTSGPLEKRKGTRTRTILVVTGDQSLHDSLMAMLDEYRMVSAVPDLQSGELLVNEAISLIVLDLSSSSPVTLALAQKLRAQEMQVPLLLLIQRESEIASIEHRGVRASDYLLKSFSRAEFAACVRALLRQERRKSKPRPFRSSPRTPSYALEEPILAVGDLVIDPSKRSVFRGGQWIEIEKTLLFDLLVYLVRHRGEVLSREHLLVHVWGYEQPFVNGEHTRTVSVHMHWLRTLLGEGVDHPRFIHTIRGSGYCFQG